MYKTVKHGENSLQYTILPQTEEVLMNNGMKGRGRDYSPCVRVRRVKIRSTLILLSSIFVMFLVAGFVAIFVYPFHSSNGWFVERSIGAYKKGKVQTTDEIVEEYERMMKKQSWKEMDGFEDAPIMKMGVRLRSTPPPRDFRVVFPLSTPPPWSMPALRSWKSAVPLTTPPPIPAVIVHGDIPLITPANDITTRFINLLSPKPSPKEETVKPSPTPDLVTLSVKIKYTTVEEVPTTVTEKTEKTTVRSNCNSDIDKNKPSTATASTQTPTTDKSKLQELKDMLFSDDDDVEWKNSEVDAAFISSAPQKPDYPGLEADDVTVSKTRSSGWYAARWPFVDTSSYFQWTGYTSSDNLLLPLLVVAASSTTFVCLMMLVLKRRKKTTTNVANAEDAPTALHVDDNTNLLIAENSEDHEE